jgi:hypothetical protein
MGRPVAGSSARPCECGCRAVERWDCGRSLSSPSLSQGRGREGESESEGERSHSHSHRPRTPHSAQHAGTAATQLPGAQGSSRRQDTGQGYCGTQGEVTPPSPSHAPKPPGKQRAVDGRARPWRLPHPATARALASPGLHAPSHTRPAALLLALLRCPRLVCPWQRAATLPVHSGCIAPPHRLPPSAIAASRPVRPRGSLTACEPPGSITAPASPLAAARALPHP